MQRCIELFINRLNVTKGVKMKFNIKIFSALHMYIYFIFNIQTYIKHLHSNNNTKHEMIGDPRFRLNSFVLGMRAKMESWKGEGRTSEGTGNTKKEK